VDENDLKGRSNRRPVVVFSHIPLWTSTRPGAGAPEDGGRELGLPQGFWLGHRAQRHIHQVMQKVEGNVTFHTARSTAFPQPARLCAPPGPMKVEDAKLRSLLGVCQRQLQAGRAAPCDHRHPAAG